MLLLTIVEFTLDSSSKNFCMHVFINSITLLLYMYDLLQCIVYCHGKLLQDFAKVEHAKWPKSQEITIFATIINP